MSNEISMDIIEPLNEWLYANGFVTTCTYVTGGDLEYNPATDQIYIPSVYDIEPDSFFIECLRKLGLKKKFKGFTMSILHDKLSIIGKDLLLNTLPNIIIGNIKRIKQNNNEATYAYNIKKEEEKIDFNKSKKEIYNQIRGLNSYPGAYAILDNKRIKIWNSYITDKKYNNLSNGEISNIYKDGIGIKVSDGEIVITDIQLEGKKRMLVSSYLNGIDKNSLKGKMLL